MAPAKQGISGSCEKVLGLQRVEGELPYRSVLCGDLSDREALLAEVPHVEESGRAAGGHQVRLTWMSAETVQRQWVPRSAEKYFWAVKRNNNEVKQCN